MTAGQVTRLTATPGGHSGEFEPLTWFVERIDLFSASACQQDLRIYSRPCLGLNVCVFRERVRLKSARVSLLALRFGTVMVLAVWFGGFTFYSTVVIATSQEVLHSQLRAGLITQQVTNWLNLISLPALAICGGNLIAEGKD